MELSYPGDARRQAKFEWLFRNGSRTGAIRCLIGGSEVPLQFFLDLYFSLGGYRPIKLPCSYFCLRNECERDVVGEVLAIAAHIDCKHIAWMRNMSNTRTRLDRLRPRRFVPKDPLHEPYLVALLIALAQRQWRALRRKTKQQEICVNLKYCPRPTIPMSCIFTRHT